MAPFRFGLGLVLALPSAAWAQLSATAEEPVHSFSPEVGAMLTEAMPKFDPLLAGAAAPAPSAPALPADGIIRLPSFIVRDRRLPTPVEVMGQEELTRYAMDKYLGPADGIDRGALNLITVREFWEKIPVLGQFPLAGFETNEERGLRLYHEDLQRQVRSDIMYMSEFLKETGHAADAVEMKHAVQAGFKGPKQAPRIRVSPGDQPN